MPPDCAAAPLTDGAAKGVCSLNAPRSLRWRRHAGHRRVEGLALRDRLADGYDMCGAGFDQMTLDALGLDRDATIAFVREKKPTYMQFEAYVLESNGGSVAPGAIEKHNAAISGYDHSDELSANMRSDSGIRQAHIKDAVTLNTVNDLDELHRQVTA